MDFTTDISVTQDYRKKLDVMMRGHSVRREQQLDDCLVPVPRSPRKCRLSVGIPVVRVDSFEKQ
jgi:hypothetical protein